MSDSPPKLEPTLLHREGRTQIALPSGRQIEVEIGSERESLVVRATNGECVLRVQLTDEGPVLSFAAAGLEIASTGRLALRADVLEIAARSARVEVAGSLVEEVGGDAVRHARGAAVIAGRDVAIEAETGGVDVRAADDVDVRGERVRLNSDDPPMPLTWEEHQRRHGPRRLGAAPETGGERNQPAALPRGSSAPNEGESESTAFRRS